MSSFVRAAVDGVRRAAEAFVALALGAMFLAFIIQIVLRYSIGLLPADAGAIRTALGTVLGWTAEISVITWLYMVLIGSALWLRERDEIRIDLLSNVLGPRERRWIAGFVSLALIVLYAMSYPAIWKYVTFMWRERTDFMKIRLDFLYSVYLVFGAAIILRSAVSVWRIVRGHEVEETDITKTTSGL